MIDLLRRKLFDFERVEARRLALLLLLGTALFSMDISMPGDLPAVRLEQLLLLALLPSLFFFYRSHPELRRPMVLDYAFLFIAAAITITIVLAPVVVSQSKYSIRDPFEVARVVEYWLMFRLAFIALPDSLSGHGIVRVLCVAAIILGAFAVVQYVNPGSFNKRITDIWADPHNLDGVLKRSRVVGTVGNANYFGILSGLLLVVMLGVILLRDRLSSRMRWLVIAATFAASVSVVMAQSRTAAFAMLGAMFLGLLFVAITRRARAAYLAAIGLFLVSVTASVVFVEVVPPKFGTFHDRFSPAKLNHDSSVTIRLSKWRSLFSGFFHDDPSYCEGENLNDRVYDGHEPGALDTANVPSDALARDATRKKDVFALSRGVLDYFCANGGWPVDAPLRTALVPKFLPAMPKDPKTGEAYLSYQDRGGFLVGANLENLADPSGPVYALGTMPNIILNASFEDGGHQPDSWQTSGDVDGRPKSTLTTVSPGRFGDRSVRIDLGPTGSVYQLVVFDFPLDREYTATVWARSDSGSDQAVLLYLIYRLASGDTEDPGISKSFAVPGDGRWVELTMPFRTPSSSRMSVLQYTVRAPIGNEHVKVDLDAATVTEGGFPPSFPWTEDVDPARLRPSDLPGFSDSPVIGIGPRKDFQTGSFDNEYALFLNRYGALGTLAYLFLFGSAFVLAMRAWRRAEGAVAVLSLGIMVYTIALAAFNVAAGSYYAFQLMAIYWLILGFLARARLDADHPTQAATASADRAPRETAAEPELVSQPAGGNGQ